MKAVTYHQYDSPEVLQLQEVAQPKLRADVVLVKIYAASINPLDWHLMRREPSKQNH